MLVIDPQSTTFQRSQAWRITLEHGRLPWRQEWRDADRISDHLKRAVIAAEDASFAEHDGVVQELTAAVLKDGLVRADTLPRPCCRPCSNKAPA